MENKIYKDYITEMLRDFDSSSPARFHMPGHKGNFPHPVLNLEYDVTELSKTDDLYLPEGVISKSESQATKFYNTKNTVFSPFGATSCIFTMLGIYKTLRGKKLLIDRTSHKSVFNALGILNIDCEYIYPELISGFSVYDALNIQNIKDAYTDDIGGILITSPNYYGLSCDLKEISDFCKEKDIILMVDNSHGSHFFFNEQKNLHPLFYGVDFCVDSLHKTLPVATGGALLHCNIDIEKSFIKKTMGIFYSSSPSYPIMSSIDSGLCYMFNNGEELYKNFSKTLSDFKEKIKEKGLRIFEGTHYDNYKILINLSDFGLSGQKFSKILNENNIFCEMSDDENILLMVSPFNKAEDFDLFIDFLNKNLPKEKTSTPPSPTLYQKRERKLSLGQCLFEKSEVIDIKNAEGRLCKDMIYNYPPGIPIILPGEVIDKNVIEILTKKSYNEITVIK